MTDEERQELEALRLEKQQRVQYTRAKTALQNAGIPVSFASLLAGRDDADTDARAEQFCTAYREEFAADVRQHLPQQPPVVAAPLPQRPKRGIQRIR